MTLASARISTPLWTNVDKSVEKYVRDAKRVLSLPSDYSELILTHRT